MLVRTVLMDRYAVHHNLCHHTVIMFIHSIERFRDFLGREPELNDLNDIAVCKFLRWRAVTPHNGYICSPASVRKDQAHIVSLWNHVAKKRLLNEAGEMVEFPDLPRNLVKVPTRVPKGYTVEEVSTLIRQGKHRHGMIGSVPAAWFWPSLIWSLWLTGERIGGHLGIRWQEVDLDKCVLTFLGENRKDRTTTIMRSISPDLAAFMRPMQAAGDQLVWPWLEHRKANVIFNSLRLHCKKCGIVPRGFHAIRKASGSYVKRAGGDSTEHLGHKNPKTTKQSYDDLDIIGRQSALDFLPPLDLDEPEAPAA